MPIENCLGELLRRMVLRGHMEIVFKHSITYMELMSNISSPISVSTCARQMEDDTKKLKLKMTAWNCHGLANSTPFLNSVILCLYRSAVV